VDAVRINKAYDDKKQIVHLGENPNRMPCREIYDNMNVDFDGTIRYCCLDPYRETDLGNVFKDGILEVWKGKKYLDLRKGHEDENCDIDPFCENCDQWAGFNIVNEYEEGGLLVRETAYSSYYNRLDRMNTWAEDTKRIEIEVIT
jgi:radical SAM protein with 4Fe4S-binding SPASM domain